MAPALQGPGYAELLFRGDPAHNNAVAVQHGAKDLFILGQLRSFQNHFRCSGKSDFAGDGGGCCRMVTRDHADPDAGVPGGPDHLVDALPWRVVEGDQPEQDKVRFGFLRPAFQPVLQRSGQVTRSHRYDPQPARSHGFNFLRRSVRGRAAKGQH